MAKARLVKELFAYLGEHKKLFLVPLIVALMLVGAVILLGQSQAMAPFIYSVF